MPRQSSNSRSRGAVQADEEAFFKEGDDEEDLGSLQSVRDTPSPVQPNGLTGPPQRPLVDYGDDDDDEPSDVPRGFLAGGGRTHMLASTPGSQLAA